MSGRSNNAGIYNFDNLNAQNLFVRGRAFEQYINELTGVDVFEQQEVDELKLLVQYLNTSGLSSEWIVDNQNKNQDLKTLITALETKLANIDTTALSQTSVLNNDNRNSVLKTRIDGHDETLTTLTGRIDGNDGSIATLNGKTRYVASNQGTNNPNTFSEFSVNVSDRILNKVYLQTANGSNLIALLTDTSTLQGQNDYPNNRILLNAPLGRIQMDCKNLQLQSPIIEIGADFAIGADSEIRLGTKRANIKIGSHQAPDLNEPTIITIGRRSVTQNTHTNLEGNIYTNEARFENLSKSQALTIGAFLSIITSSGLPLYINIFSALSLSSYVHSDLWGLAGSVVKNGDVQTTNDIKVKSYSLYNTDVNLVDLFPVENTFIASGSSTKTLLLGSIKEQVFKNGSDITLRHNNIVATNINWALSEANDNVNALCIKGDDGILLHQGASSVGASMKILNSKSGKIELLLGNAGTQASCLTGIQVDWNSGQPQTIIGSKVALQNAQQNNSKLLVQQTSSAGQVGIEVVKANQAEAPLFRTTISDDNVDTHSLTLKTNFTGTTTKALYLDNTDHLRFNGNLVTPVKDIVAGAHISVVNNDGIYTISKTGGGGGGSVAEVGEDLIISAIAVQLPRKPAWYGQNFLRYSPLIRMFYDVYMSANGKYIYYANRITNNTAATLVYNTSYFSDGFFYETDGITTDIVLQRLWISVCGTFEGSKVWAVGSNEIWTNEPSSATNIWTQATTPPDFANAVPVQMRVNGDGKYQLITDARVGSYGRIHKSNDYGATWTQYEITLFPFVPRVTRALGCCVSSSGKTMYVCCDGTNGGTNAENGGGGVYASQDYGVNWNRVLGVTFGQHDRVSCDATGRYVVAVGSTYIFSSKNYGATWKQFNFGAVGRSCYVSHSGDYIWVSLNTNIDNLIYSTDHGQTFTYGNYPVGSNYINMVHDCIACNNDGSIVFTGSASGYYINSFREFPSDVRQITGSTNISVQETGQGLWQINWIAPTAGATIKLGYRYAGALTALVNFNTGVTYYLQEYRVTGRCILFVDANFDYPIVRLSGEGNIASSSNIDEQSWSEWKISTNPYTNQDIPYNSGNSSNYLDRSCCFSNVNIGASCQVIVEFTIDLLRDGQDAFAPNNTVIRGRVSHLNKPANGTNSAYKMYTFFERHTRATFLNQLTFGTFGGYNNSITYASLNLEIIPLPTFNNI